MGNVAEALSFYKKYLRERPDAPNRAEVEKRIDELEAIKVPQPMPAVAPLPEAPATALTPPQPAAPASATRPGNEPVTPLASPTGAPEASGSVLGTVPPPTVDTTPAGVDVIARTPPQPSESGTIFRKWWFWATAGVVVVAGGIGTFLALSGTKPAKHYQGDMDPPLLTVPP